jgi:hypothetical protein
MTACAEAQRLDEDLLDRLMEAVLQHYAPKTLRRRCCCRVSASCTANS